MSTWEPSAPSVQAVKSNRLWQANDCVRFIYDQFRIHLFKCLLILFTYRHWQHLPQAITFSGFEALPFWFPMRLATLHIKIMKSNTANPFFSLHLKAHLGSMFIHVRICLLKALQNITYKFIKKVDKYYSVLGLSWTVSLNVRMAELTSASCQ